MRQLRSLAPAGCGIAKRAEGQLWGQDDQFAPPRLSGRSAFSEETLLEDAATRKMRRYLTFATDRDIVNEP
jgi:hypothetical protein